MGPLEENSISELTFRPINPDGTYGDPVILERFQDITYSLDENGDEFCTVGFDLAKGSDMTAYGYIRLPNKKMSRKTFKKWLMHLPQHDRNFAERWCYIIGMLKGHMSYAESYLYMLLDPSGLSLLNFIINKLEETEE